MASLWEDAVITWFERGYISGVNILSESKVCVLPGNVDNFGFHFIRDLIPLADLGMRNSLNVEADPSDSYIISFSNWSDLSPESQEVFLAFRKIAEAAGHAREIGGP